ncbi:MULTISPECIES: FprA family A-type flavoprotein [Petrimonas]|jgi:anaerobic nitric oxide reductase flavorubredoxin|uniref:Flavo-diiron protein FprA1 n=1 Tax=Petrimonas mucosa TaxID=1642646 RepID=A0A1G4G6S6_9BACT|nr:MULTISPECIES: FprA family A-type flavoprotein [Petrimonas]MDD3560173.1 FprA family A-type flavoprotein [Petrimonas mucosa]SCM57447.1 Flavo-diiron protein FprA1 [Petrimonas mucosa]SFU33221.1 Flavorubredoxin [Porphyromonadaceae bacterium KHP3R9]HHT29155.1 FprA family A-type flavoprotein [Petrimonas mucosa]
MYKPFEIKENLFYVGVNDRTKHLFENLWPLPKGVSYNSYIIDDEKVALIDTVDICYADVFFNKIGSVLGDKPIDYLVVNHMEPDHSGSVRLLKTRYPDIQIVGNSRTAEMLRGYYGISDNVLVVEDKAELKLGKNSLQFYLTPMVHWPETMMTYVKESGTLFSADAFGTFGTLDGGVTDTQLDPDRYWDEMIRYYSNIVGKFGSPVQAALKKLSGMGIETICSTHGPVWTQPDTISRVVALYDRLSRYEAERGLVIAYGSMYGNTEQLAEVIAAAAAGNGVRNIVMHNLSKSHESEVLRDIFTYRGLIIGSPTYNNKLYPPVEGLLSAIQNRNVRNRFFSYFTGHTWADGAKRELKAFAESMEFETVGESVEMKQSLNNDIMEHAYALGKAMAEKLCSGEAVMPNKLTCH